MIGPLIGGELISIDDPPDFLLCREGRVTGWVEVTTAVDGEALALQSWLAKNGDGFDTDVLAKDWILVIARGTRLDDLDQDQITGMLRLREGEVPDPRDVYREPRPADFSLAGRANIWYAMSSPRQGELSRVRYQGPGFGSSVHPSLVNDLAVEKANQKAVSFEGLSGERHLVVLVNPDWHTGAGFVLTDEERPETPPGLPNQITDVWMATVRSLVWHYSAGEPNWRVLNTGA